MNRNFRGHEIAWFKVFVAGIGATAVMDFSNKVGFLLGFVYKMDVTFLGCLFYGWTQGIFTFDSPSVVMSSGGTKMQGLLGHYLIGIIFSFALYGLSKLCKFNRIELYVSALLFGMVAACISLLFIFPTTGMGLFGWKIGIGLLGASIYNHVAFGIGLAISFRVLNLEKNLLST